MTTTEWNETNWKARFFTIWGGQAISLFGSRLVQFALIWWLTEKTGSATVLATASLVGLVPQVLLGPIVGTLVDRWSRRATMIVADSLIAVVTLVLAYLFSIGVVGIGVIYGLLFARAIGGGFHWPAMSASTSLMVPKDQLTRVQGLNQMLQGVMGIVSAPLGALLVGFMATQNILLIDVSTALFAIVPLFFISVPEPKRRTNGATGQKATFWEDFRSGFAYVWSWPGLVMLMGMAMLLNLLLTPAASLLPILITQHFNGGAIQLGWTEAAFGVGMLTGGILLSVWGGFKRRILTSLSGIILLGISFASIGFIPANGIWLAVASLFVAAMTLPIVNGPIHAIVQAAVTPDMQGRVFTLMGSLSSGMAPLGLLIAGPIADKLGIQTWYVVGGVTCILVGVAGYFIPAVMNVERNNGTTQSAEVQGIIPAPSSAVSVQGAE